MDPNNNPTPTPNPEPVMPPEPAPAGEPTPVSEPSPAPEPPVVPAPEPAEPAGPAPVEPAAQNPLPVNPVINPGVNPEPVNPVFQPTGQGGLAATDPIMQPEAPTPPDPIEEELKAPMKAAGPVPGSIGSAMSGPTDAPAEAPAENPAENPFAAATQPQAQNVSFTDPAAQPDDVPSVAPAKPAGKNNKTVLIALIAVAAVVVIVLVVILIMSLMPQGNNNSGSTQTGSVDVVETVEPDESTDSDGDNVVVAGTSTLSCTRNMTPQELVNINDAASGAINISAEFDDGEMASISRVDSVVYSDEDATATEPVENEVHESKAADLTAASALNYFLNANADGEIDTSLEAVQTNYENLDFTCEVL